MRREPIAPPDKDRVDRLAKMLRAQLKFLPAGVTGVRGSRASCYGLSPFVAERRGLFVAWEVRGLIVAFVWVLSLSLFVRQLLQREVQCRNRGAPTAASERKKGSSSGR